MTESIHEPEVAASPDGATRQVRERYVQVGDVRTHYWEGGDGAPVVLLHGGGAGADAFGNWQGCLPLFTPAFRPIALDMVGFGRTVAGDPGFEYSQDARVEHLEGFLDELGLDQVAIVGNSMGGATALGLAMRSPTRVRGLVLMGSAGLTHEFSAELQTIIEYREPDRDGMRRIVGALTHASFDPDERLVDYRYRLTLEESVMSAYRATMGWIREVGGLFYDEEAIAEVQVPTLVVSGREDAVVPMPLSVRLHELLENSWLYVIPKCGHWAMIEHPLDFSTVTTRFLTQQEESL